MFCELLLQVTDLGVVVVEALAKVLLHIFYFGIFGEEWEEVVDLQDGFLEDFEGTGHIDGFGRTGGGET